MAVLSVTKCGMFRVGIVYTNVYNSTVLIEFLLRMKDFGTFDTASQEGHPVIKAMLQYYS